MVYIVDEFLVTGHRHNVAKESICKAKQKRKRGSPNQHRHIRSRSMAGKTADQHRILLRPIKQQDHRIIKHMVRHERQLHRAERTGRVAESDTRRHRSRTKLECEVFGHPPFQWVLPR